MTDQGINLANLLPRRLHDAAAQLLNELNVDVQRRPRHRQRIREPSAHSSQAIVVQVVMVGSLEAAIITPQW